MFDTIKIKLGFMECLHDKGWRYEGYTSKCDKVPVKSSDSWKTIYVHGEIITTLHYRCRRCNALKLETGDKSVVL